MKKILISVTVFAIVFACVIACGNSFKGESTAEAPKQPAGDTIKIDISGWTLDQYKPLLNERNVTQQQLNIIQERVNGLDAQIRVLLFSEAARDKRVDINKSLRYYNVVGNNLVLVYDK